MKIGATGKFPLGKLDEADEGELLLAVSRVGDNVRIDFGKPVAWLAMPSEQAIGLARLIVMKAGTAK